MERTKALQLVEEGNASVKEACRFLGVGHSKLYAEMGAGRLPYLKVGSKRLIPWRALKVYAAARLVGADEQTG